MRVPPLSLAAVPAVAHPRTPTGRWGRFDAAMLEGIPVERSAKIDISFAPDGSAPDGAASRESAPDGVHVLSLAGPLDGEDRRMVDEKLFSLIAPGTDAHTALHAALRTGGVLIHIDKTQREPIHLTHRYTPGTAAYRNTLVVCAPGVEATIVEHFIGAPAAASHLIEAFVGCGASLTHATLHEVETLFSARKRASAARDARMHWFEFAVSDGLSFSRVATSLDGTGAATKNLAIFLSTRGHVDFGAYAEHNAEQTTSGLVAKGVLSGDATSVYEGAIAIGTTAARSSAFQEEHVLLLSDGAESHSNPGLFIDNNDVRCSHAASVGRIDAAKRFYLMSRGLSREAAEELLVTAFVWPVLEQLDVAAACKLSPLAASLLERFVPAAHAPSSPIDGSDPSSPASVIRK